jgi:adenine-specific DNA-methyltransferase
MGGIEMVDDSLWDTLTASQLTFPPEINPLALPLQEKIGAVYTKPWVVELILNLAGYTPEKNLVDRLAIEPAAGNGAFLVPMARRLATSCQQLNRPIADMATSLLAYELDEISAASARSAVTSALAEQGIAFEEAMSLADGWIHISNYLFDASGLPLADFVIGNPPYIRLEDMDDATMGAYRVVYRTMRGRADIYIAFFEAALRSLKPNGICAFICADRWMYNQYGAELRRLVTRGFSVEAVVEMHNADAFAFDVSAYPAITVIRREKQGPVVVGNLESHAEVIGGDVLATSLRTIRSGNNEPHIPSNLQAARIETWFTGLDPWPCVAPAQLALLRRLEDQFPPLESVETGTKVGIGVATGLDEVFITTNPELVESSRLLPLAMAADTIEGHFRWSGHYLVDPWMSKGLVDLEQFPRLKAYFTLHSERLKKRHTVKQKPQHWYKTIDRVNHTLVKKRKLYFPDIKNRINPVLDEGQTYPHHNLYYVQSDQWDPEILGGILMSSVGQFFVECYGVRMRGGYFRFQAQYLRRIRVPRPQDISADQQITLTNAFRRRDVTLATRTALDIYHITELPMENIDI